MAEALGYSNASKAVSVHVSEEERILKTLEADAKNGNVVSSKVPFGYFFIYHCSELRYWLNYKHIFRGCTSTTSEAFQSLLQTFSNSEFGDVRVITKDGEPWFVGKDVAEILGYSNTRKALADHVDEEDKGVTKCDTLGGVQDLTVINESGLYSLILSSKMPNAKKFKHWVTSEVLPSICKHSDYVDENYNKIACAITILYI